MADFDLLGLATAICGVVGDDVFGRFMVEALQAAGVNADAVTVSTDRPTGLSIILSEGTDRAILTFSGSIDALDADAVDLDLVRSVRDVHVSSYFLQRGLHEGLPSLFEEAHRAGATTSVDPNWDARGGWDGGLLALLSEIDVFLPNETEVRAIAHLEDTDAAARSLADPAGVVAVKCGPGGALAVRGEETVRTEVPPSDVEDTIGAGDSFDAGFIAGRLAGGPLADTLRLAVACGSHSTRGVGGTATQPPMAEAR